VDRKGKEKEQVLESGDEQDVFDVPTEVGSGTVVGSNPSSPGHDGGELVRSEPLVDLRPGWQGDDGHEADLGGQVRFYSLSLLNKFH
jgi:hypothetical protein